LPARWSVLALSFVAASVSAQLSIEITGAGAQRTPVAVVPFAGEGALPPSISSIIRTDLERPPSTTPSGARASPMRWWSARWCRCPAGASRRECASTTW
jgi:Tol biopolymer transport system component